MGKAHRSLTRSGFLWVMVAAGFLLLVLAAARWRENGPGTLVWLASFLAMFVIRLPYSIRNRKNAIVEAHKGPDEVILLFAMFATMMLLPLAHLATGCFAFADYALPGGVVAAGAFLQIPFLILFWRAHADLGRNWSPGLEVRQDHTLVTHGIYRRIRHPMYAAIWLSALAQPLLIQNWIAGFLVLPAFAAMWIIRVPREEAMLRRRFAQAWDGYCLRAGRVFPKFGTSAGRDG
ncbi:protein-S-isoprenylcysteine O-methyltransferase [Desulfolutivibrio sulfodismutans]|nr:protein-S-isoprenylcysteine O-methyltransferase [Desulfolutivibrio sulfodismutans]